MQVRIATERTGRPPLHSPAVTKVPRSVLRFWRALDALVDHVQPTRWGAVVSDDRFPAIWDVNYARLEGAVRGVTVDEIERDLLPALDAAGVETEHVVAFDPDAAGDVLATFSSRGHRLSWDLVMTCTGAPGRVSNDVEVAPIDLDDAAWRDIRRSLVEDFGVDEGPPLAQVMRLEREVLALRGKRWFGVRVRGRSVSVAAVMTLEGVAYVDNVATDARFRGRGYASAITDRIVRSALEDGAETVFLLADPDDASAVRLYERLGFTEAGRIASTRGPRPR
jgi:ribosomal protein S18 acetylase RimI-like enzyme